MSRNRSAVRIAFFGSSLVSAYWNGAATYYRGIIRALDRLGYRVTFYEPHAFDRQQHRDMEEPPWARVWVYPAHDERGVREALADARGADLVVKASGVGVFDDLLERAVLELQSARTRVIFWDVDAPATLDRIRSDPQDHARPLIPQYDLVLTYGGGPPVINAYTALGARQCVPVCNAHDPLTHHPVPAQPRYTADLAFLGNRLPDREARVEQFFLEPATRLPDKRFLLGGSGWESRALPDNVTHVGHVYTGDHNAFNCSPLAVLNISRQSMADYGYSPATRVFEAAASGACLVTDAWTGIEQFLEPDREILVAADGDDVAAHLVSLSPARARSIGEAARERVLSEHTYDHRARQLHALLESTPMPKAPCRTPKGRPPEGRTVTHAAT